MGNNQKKNEINMIIKINENDINKKIYFLDDIDKEKSPNSHIEYKSEHNNLKEMNKKNTNLYINDIEEKYDKFFVFEKPGNYRIKLVFKKLIKNCSFMFYNCINLISIDMSNFNSSKTTNMDRMFCGCENLIELNLTNFDTKNVTTMRSIFYDCKKLTNIDLSSFNTENVNDMRCMFSGAENLQKINLSNFNTKNVNNMRQMFWYCKNLKTRFIKF
jgi:surface protein